jgi:hypothetical protein
MADPQVNPNALGAPTEGFGQTVTFAFDPRGVTPSLEIPKSVPGRFGAEGTSRAQLQDPNAAAAAVGRQPRDGTADLLMRVGADILAPQLEAEKNRKFVEGVQRAMGGEAVADMQAEQPWYSRIFGDTPAIEGARVYEVSNKVNEIVSQQTANMDSLKTLDPKSAAKHFSKLMDSQMTGDPNTDRLTAKGLLDHIPGLMKAQAKAYYGHVQKSAMDGLSKNMASSADSLQQAGQLYAEGTLSEQDMAVRKAQFVNSIMPPAGINEENYGKVLAANIRRAAEAGAFHAVQAVKESGGFDALTPEQQNTVNAAVETAAKKHRDNYAFKYAKEIAELRSDQAYLPTGMATADIAKRYEQMNDAYKKLTGSPLGLFSSDEMANGLAGALNNIKAEERAAAKRANVLADRQATADAKLLAHQQQEAAVQSLVNEGNVYLAGTVTKATKDEIDVAAYKAFTNADNPQVGTDLLRNNFIRGGYVNPIIKQQMQSLLRSSEGRDAPTADFFAAAEKYQRLAGGSGSTALADAYFGDYAPKLERFIRMTGGDAKNPNVAQAFAAAMDNSETQKPDPLPTKEAAKLAKEVSSKLDPMLPKWLGGLHLRDETADMVAQLAEKHIADWRAVPGLTDSEAVSRGINSAVAAGRMELIGGFAVNRSLTSGGNKTLREYASSLDFNVPTDKVDDYFKSFLMTKRVDSGRANIVYGGERNGTAYFAFTYQEKGEPVRMGTFTGAEWARYATEQGKNDTGPRKPIPWAVGPYVDYSVPGVPRAMSDKPSIYASQAEWAAYRAEQDRKVKSKPN